MENFKPINNSIYYKSTINSNIIALNKNCNCGRSYYQKYKPFTFNCSQCNEIKELKRKNGELENKLEKIESEKDLIIENLKKKLAIFETNENNLNQSISQIKVHRNEESELESTTSHSESNYSLIEEPVENSSNINFSLFT